MSSTLAHGAGNRSLGESYPLGALAASPALLVLLLAGLGLRLTIAYVLFPASGFATDLASYASWALTLGQHGPAGFYANAGFSDYPPGYLYVLWPIGLLARASLDPTAVASGLVKLPPILIDLAVGYVLYVVVRSWSRPGRASEALALVAAGLYVLNPVSFYDSALWGQTDAAGALVMLLGLVALIRGNSEGATAFATLAALIKPQFGVVLIPLVGVILLKRHLVHAGSGPRHRPWGPASVADWLDAHRGPVRLLTSITVGLLTFHVVALPFGLDMPAYLQLMAETAGGYEYLTVNAFNPWALLGTGGTPSFAEARTWSSDTVAVLGPIPAVAVGATLLAAGFLWALVRAAVRDDRWTLLIAATALAIAFFVLPTRVHERYVFPAIAVLPLLAVVSRRWMVALVLLGAGALINMHAILTWPLYATENVADLPLGPTFRTMPLIATSALLQTGVFLYAAWELRPSAATRPDAYDGVAADRGTQAAGSPVVVGQVPPPAPVGDAPAGLAWSPARRVLPPHAPVSPRVSIPAAALASDAPVEARAVAGPAPVGWVRGPGILDQLTSRFTRPPIRGYVERSARRERPGRLDRLDLLIIALLVVGAATIRGFRVDEPYAMYFDEVYHARTATEFLQHWEYGEPHAIYEYTHPHLAKYAMAAGIRLFGGHGVSGTADLGTTVEDAALETRWAPAADQAARHGDRLYVATGNELRIHDLATRELVGSIPVAARTLALDPGQHRLYVADGDGAIASLDTTSLDLPIAPSILGPDLLEPLVEADGSPVERLVVTDVSLIALTADGRLVAYAPESGEPLAIRELAGARDLAELPWTDRVVVDTGAIDDLDEVAGRLAELLAGDSATIGAQLASGTASVVVDAYLDEAARSDLAGEIEAGTLPGVSLVGAPTVAVAAVGGVTVVDAETLDIVDELLTMEPATGLALVASGLDRPTLYAASGETLQVIGVDDDGPSIQATVPMPGPIRMPVWNEPANLVHVLGTTPEGSPTMYVVEVHGNAVFADAELPFEPETLVLDVQPERPAVDRGQALAIGQDGRVAAVDVLREASAWRIPGVLMGALAAGLLYALARLLFARRSVAILAGALVLVEGMLFANARIAMNDVYVTTFILLAAVLFAPVYLGSVRRTWKGAALLLGVGLALGLALASKWVALYAMGALVLLVLMRSALGRLLALVGFIAATAVLGAIAIRPAETEDPSRNWTFLAIMLVITSLLAAGVVRRPLPLSRPEWLIGGALPILTAAGLALAATLLDQPLLGGLVTSSRLLLVAAALSLGGACVLVLAWLSGRRPSAARRPRRQPSAWLTPARAMGLGWLFTLGVIAVLPVVLYVASYAPWVDLGNQWIEGVPEGHTGQTLAQLTASMYDYHDDLRAEHAASSPWWAWPLDLKPVWFFQDSYAGPTTGLIYDTGNIVVFWLGIPAMAFAAWAAWRRRSLGLGVVVVLWLALWLPWARIDRATFQYHVYASLPFLVITLGYLLAELWRGPGPRTWFIVRAAAALAVLGIPLLWLARQPLCRLAGTSTANPDGIACGAVERTAQLSPAAIGGLLVLAAGVIVVAWLAWRRGEAGAHRYPLGRSSRWSRATTMLPALVAVAATILGILAVTVLLDGGGTFTLTVSPEVLALLGLVVLAPVAALLVRSRDPRRLVLGILAAAAVWFIAWYPNIAGLPLPSGIASVYQGVLPTWNYDFQFAVNLDPPSEGPLIDTSTFVIGIVAAACAVGAAAAARSWGRRPRVERGVSAPDISPAAAAHDPRSSWPGL